MKTMNQTVLLMRAMALQTLDVESELDKNLRMGTNFVKGPGFVGMSSAGAAAVEVEAKRVRLRIVLWRWARRYKR